MAKTVVLANHKGGVSKTTLATSLADAFARDGLEVLLVDLDPQANATGLVYSFEEAPAAPVEKMLDGSVSVGQAIIENTRIDGVHLIGATLKLLNVERTMMHDPFASTSLLDTLLAPVHDSYDVIILDCPPSLSFLTANAMSAGDLLLVPVQSGSKLSLMGADDMLNFMRGAMARNPRLQFGGAVLTRHDARKKMCKIMAGVVRQYYEQVLDATLPDSTDIDKAQTLGKTILQHDREHNAARQVVAIAREVMGKLGLAPKEAAHV
ncbi:MAG: ParA family protein [Telluria sp.]